MIVKINGEVPRDPQTGKPQSLIGFKNDLPRKLPSQFEEFDPVFAALGLDANPEALLLYWTNGLSINVQNCTIVDDQNRD